MSDTFEFLVSQNKGNDLIIVINNILESEYLNIEHFIKHPNVQELKKICPKNFCTLELFSRGDYLMYKKDQSIYINLTDKMINKLKKITLVNIAGDNKVLNYSNLMNLLDLKDQFELDQMIFDINILGWVQGKVDHKTLIFKVNEVKPRDFINDWDFVVNKIENWINKIEKVDGLLDHEINSMKISSNEYDNYLNAKSIQNKGINNK